MPPISPPIFLAALQWYGLNDRDEAESYVAVGRERPTSKTFLTDYPDIAKLRRVIAKASLTKQRAEYDEIGSSPEEQNMTERTRSLLGVYAAAMTSYPPGNRQQLVGEAVEHHEAAWPREDPFDDMAASVTETAPLPAAERIKTQETFALVSCMHAIRLSSQAERW